ncbi:MAG: hypothetical protein R2755_16395 [Acidimicrobiales bacterium]
MGGFEPDHPAEQARPNLWSTAVTDAAPDRPTGLVTVDVVLPRAAGRRQLAALRLWLTDGDHVRIPLRAIPVTAPQPDTGDARGSGYDGTGGRIDPADRRSVPTTAVSAALRPAEDHRLRGRFVGAAPCGTYVLCGDGSEVALRFPPRPVEVGAGAVTGASRSCRTARRTSASAVRWWATTRRASATSRPWCAMSTSTPRPPTA